MRPWTQGEMMCDSAKRALGRVSVSTRQGDVKISGRQCYEGDSEIQWLSPSCLRSRSVEILHRQTQIGWNLAQSSSKTTRACVVGT
ncbi:hypothetical protein PC116_g4142 [Phytophthora cactorum]|uniref:Uncharacterized protein n=1 Tax=Phytophthora cactorum TaxID=29920 RepID=A0A8T1LH10_9STRA|nr:hypothetical protein PC117_g2225 [Phytophthora cactorum]KAG3190652.1 hypothetical protein C6341_g1651 [Phytophthora cactorum]KAG4248080.1 hypothetical protein PC116_g4142 [Phytophthora cactorum]